MKSNGSFAKCKIIKAKFIIFLDISHMFNSYAYHGLVSQSLDTCIKVTLIRSRSLLPLIEKYVLILMGSLDYIELFEMWELLILVYIVCCFLFMTMFMTIVTCLAGVWYWRWQVTNLWHFEWSRDSERCWMSYWGNC